MLAGKTAISRAMIPQAANGDQPGTKSNRPSRISIAPLSPTNSLGNGIYGGTILTKKSGVTKCIVPAPSPTSPTTSQKYVISGEFDVESSLHLILHYCSGEPQLEFVEEDLLMFSWARDASATDVDTSPCWQYDVNKSNL